MDPTTWKMFCQSIVDMKGIVSLAVNEHRTEKDFKCNRCEMTWKTAMKLDGVTHRALMNVCGGTWKALEPARETAAEKPAGGSPVLINGEEFEIEGDP